MNKTSANSTPPLPVALFTFNRPDKTRVVLDALQSQPVSKLYIFCDGPRKESDLPLVRQNREFVESFTGFPKEVIASEENKGLARSLFEGISRIFEQEERLVIVEDDCVPLPGILRFMVQNLDYWEDRPEIFSIAAHHRIEAPFPSDYRYDVFLCPRFFSWGWSTWKSRWENVPKDLLTMSNPFGTVEQVPLTAGADVPTHARKWVNKQVDSWAIPLALYTLANNLYHVIPIVSLVQNIGLDGSGIHCGNTEPGQKYSSEGFSPEELAFYGKVHYDMCPPNHFDERIHMAFLHSMAGSPSIGKAGWVKAKMRGIQFRVKDFVQKI